jgi:hypothetical protein
MGEMYNNGMIVRAGRYPCHGLADSNVVMGLEDVQIRKELLYVVSSE